VLLIFVSIRNKSFEGTVSPKGESVKGDRFMEHYVDEQALQALVIELFYEAQDRG